MIVVSGCLARYFVASSLLCVISFCYGTLGKDDFLIGLLSLTVSVVSGVGIYLCGSIALDAFRQLLA